jgi:anti-sigma factor RsiW
VSSADNIECSDWELMLHSFIDGELDAIHSLQFEKHLATCAHCANEIERFQALKQVIGQKGVNWRAPAHVRAQVLDAVAREARMRRLQTDRASAGGFSLLGFVRQWMFVPSFAALAASLFLVMGPMGPITSWQARSSVQDEVVASHVRSLLVNHLTDVATSDQHTVKPWFNGKIDFAPPVVDLAPQGFPLVGGRVDYIGGRVVAALVYRRHGHIINLFIWPSAPGTANTTTRDGYNIANWTTNELDFTAISDVNAGDMSEFHQAYSEQTTVK